MADDDSGLVNSLNALTLPDKTLIAVSGGRDSMALLDACAQACSARQNNTAAFIAATVDHGLRDGARVEATMVSDYCSTINIAHETLRWNSDEPVVSAVQARARNARYRLLIDHAYKHKCGAILTAHTQDDLAETVLMRLARGAGARGLAAMGDETQVASGPGAVLRLLRPMLGISRQSTTQYCKERSVPFCDDPGNQDPAFERVRWRALLGALQTQDLLTTKMVARSAGRLKSSVERENTELSSMMARVDGVFEQWGGISIDPQNLPALSPYQVQLLASRLVHAVSGQDYAPDAERAGVAVNDALETGKSALSGAMFHLWKSRLWVYREPAGLKGRRGASSAPKISHVQSAGACLWDRRFIVKATINPAQLYGQSMPITPWSGAPAALFNGPPEALESVPCLAGARGQIHAPLAGFTDHQIAWHNLSQERFFVSVIRFA